MESKLQDVAVDVVENEVDALVAVCKEDVAVAERELHGAAVIVAMDVHAVAVTELELHGVIESKLHDTAVAMIESDVDIVLSVHDKAMAMTVAVAEMELDGVP
uniref:Uncharacterized protein n=1 Tax=Oryza barthii TaxID=65489 RepID=A0A0D3HKF7_9ORYZ